VESAMLKIKVLGLLFILTLTFIVGCKRESKTGFSAPTSSIAKQYPDPVFPEPGAPVGYLTAGPTGFTFPIAEEDKQWYPLPEVNQEVIKKNEEEKTQFFRTQFVGSFEKKGNTKAAWADLARKALESAAKAYACRTHESIARYDQLRKDLKAAVDAGCDDVLIRFFIWRHDTDRDLEPIKKIAAEIEQLDHSVALRFYSKMDVCVENARAFPGEKKSYMKNNRQINTEDNTHHYEPIWPYLTEVLKQNEYYFDRIAYTTTENIESVYLKAGKSRKDVFDQVMECMKAAGASVWIQKLYEGSFYIHNAWDARGRGFANTVTERGWEVFYERLEFADSALRIAHNEKQDRPEAASEMIMLAMGKSRSRAEMEKWFELAIKADPLYFSAYIRKLEYLHPKWSGSEEEYFTFAYQCLRTELWQIDCPLLMLYAMVSIEFKDNIGKLNWESSKNYFQNCREIFEPYLVKNPGDKRAMCTYARCAYLGKRYDLARYLFLKVGNEPVLGWHSFEDINEYKRYNDAVRNLYIESLDKEAAQKQKAAN
jgi:hypothetical protein